MLKDILRLLVALSFLAPGPSFGRQSAPPASDDAATAELISRAAARVAEYKERFKDLIAEETQRIEEYGAEGLKRRREVVSDLIIYQSQIESSTVVEYRNVRMVDGKEVAKRDRRVEQLFGRLAKADSIKKELERIAKESKRYDLDYSAYNHTLDQGIPLNENLRPHFRFTVTGGERIDGHDVIEVRYEQVSQAPDLNFKFSSLPKRLKDAESFHRGRLWLDRDTARLRREEREVMMRHPSLPAPLTVMKFEFSYADSRFEILTPARIIFSVYNRGRDLPGGGAEMSLGGRVVFEYGKFSRFGVDSPDSRLDAPGVR
ncbi:MAG TPA: hypothetical protein VD861_02150 [Pyrinomonadaceae bacterium]|nr:hypothetical protein [Pyrinomonadaceae bacterium]